MTERINKTKPYFQLFNVVDDVAYALIKIPQEWSAPEEIANEHHTVIQKDNAEGRGYYIYSEISKHKNGINDIFDTIDAIIEFNKVLEQRANIFKQKVNKLKELIYSEPIEKLLTLEFTFKETKSTKKSKKGKKVIEVIEPVIEAVEDTINDVAQTTEEREEIREEIVANITTDDNNNNMPATDGDNSLVGMLKDLTE